MDIHTVKNGNSCNRSNLTFRPLYVSQLLILYYYSTRTSRGSSLFKIFVIVLYFIRMIQLKIIYVYRCLFYSFVSACVNMNADQFQRSVYM